MTWPLPLWQRAYLGLAALSSMSGIVHGRCILTTWEQQLREVDQPGSAYEGTFVAHYLPVVPTEVADGLFVLLALAALIGAVQASRQWAGRGRKASQAKSTPGGDRG